MLQTSYVDSRWHQNWTHTSLLHFFYCWDTEIRKIVIFWVKRSVPENFQREKFSGIPTMEPLRTQDSENVVGLGDRASVIAAESEVIGQKTVVL